MRAAFRLFLIIMLALTSQGLAAARGQPRAVSELVICAGAAVVTLGFDSQGRPVKHRDFCPDMAPQLLAAVDHTASPPLSRQSAMPADASVQVSLAAGRDAPSGQARDPPQSVG